MILRKLEIQNFRQLHGTARVEFAPPGPKNVTVFIGENGAGKSTLLHAMRWCLYGRSGLDTDVGNPEDLLSHRALQEASDGKRADVMVELEFAHESQIFRVNRRHRYSKVALGKEPQLDGEEFGVKSTRRPSDPSSWQVVDTPNDLVQLTLPKALLPYFFFAGEAAGAWVDPRRAGELRAAVKNILDFAVLDSTKKHAEVLAVELDRQLQQLATGDGRTLEVEIESLTEEVDTATTTVDRLEAEIAALVSEVALTEQALEEYEETRPLIERKKILDVSEKLLTAQKASIVEQIALTVREAAQMALLEPAMHRLLQLLEEAYRKDDLPARIKPGFVDELLRTERCICGTPLPDGSLQRATLVAFRESSGLDTVATELQTLDGRLKGQIQNIARFRERFEAYEGQYHVIAKGIADGNSEVIEIDRKLDGKRSDDFQLQELLKKRRGLAASSDGLERARRDARANLGAEDDGPEITHTLRARLRVKLEARAKLHRGDEAARLLVLRIKVLRTVGNAARQLGEGWLSIVQKHLNTEVQRVYSEMAILDRRVGFDSECRLSMQELVDGRWVESAASSANQAVLALCFVASIIQLADQVSRDAASTESSDALGGDQLPMVMDAPFAKMGEYFSGKVPGFLARTVPQLVIMTSERQWAGGVQESLSPRVGRACALHLHTSAGASRAVQFLGRGVPYVTRDASAVPDYTIIEEVEV